jgi:TolB protein
VRVAEDIRARIRAVLNRDTSRRQAERLVEKLVRQPGALRSSLAIVLVALPSLGVWLAVMGVAAGLYMLCFLRIFNGLLLIIAAFAAIAGFFFLFRGQFTDRQALRLLTLHFSARAPAREGEPHRCRSCNAPLVEPPGSVLVACVYCGEENVLGLDARREAATQDSETASLEETLFQRRDEHRRWRWAAVWAMGLLALSAVLVLVSLGPPHDLAAQGNAGDLERLTYDPMNEFSPAPSPDGRLLLYDLRVPEEEHDDAIMASGPDGAFRGTEYVGARQHARRPVWLPDGSGFLYVAEPGNGRATLRHALSAARFAPVRDLASAGHDIDRPSVSPDSKRVAYAAAETHRGGYYMYVATLDGVEKTKLGAGLNPAWSPDGSVIAYTRTINRYRQIMLRDPDGNGSVKALTSGSCHHEDATWSGDGAFIGYIANCGHRGSSSPIWNLFVMRADGSGVQQLTDGTADMEQPVWGGDFVYFSVNVAGNFDIWRVRLGGPLAGHARRAPQKS